MAPEQRSRHAFNAVAVTSAPVATRLMEPANGRKAATMSRLALPAARHVCCCCACSAYTRAAAGREELGDCPTGACVAGDRWARVAAAHSSSHAEAVEHGQRSRSAVNGVDVHVTTRRRRRTSRCAPARTRRPWPLHTQRWRTVMCRRAGEVVRVQRDGARVVCMWAEAKRLLQVMITLTRTWFSVSCTCQAPAQTRRARLNCARQDRPPALGLG